MDATFDLADVRAIDSGFHGQCGLRPASGQPVLPEHFTEAPADEVLPQASGCRCTRHALLSLQLFDGAVQEEVGPDIEPFGDCQEHGERGLASCPLEE